MSQKTSSETTSCYTDGVRVKIAEKYKPPPRITLGMTYSQRLSLNRQLQVSMPTYAFETDAYVLEKMRDWRTARQKAAEERKQVEVERRRRVAEEKLSADATLTSHDGNDLQVSPTRVPEGKRASSMLIPTQAHILTPPRAQLDDSPINISDFEPDTASPFDNLELKTLNDIEELKMVLQNEDKNKFQPPNNQTYASSQSAYCSYAPPSSSADSVHVSQSLFTPTAAAETLFADCGAFALRNYNYSQECATYEGLQTSKAMTHLLPMNGVTKDASVANIMRSLQNQLQLNVSNGSTTAACSQQHQQSKRVLSTPSIDSNQENHLEDPYAHLPQHSQAICESIATMGFALARVARACKALGDDEKKIVEYLLTMSQLMDLGFSEERVAAALIQADHDRDKALEVLIS